MLHVLFFVLSLRHATRFEGVLNRLRHETDKSTLRVEDSKPRYFECCSCVCLGPHHLPPKINWGCFVEGGVLVKDPQALRQFCL